MAHRPTVTKNPRSKGVKPESQHSYAVEGEKAPRDSVSSTIAKWLIPSVTVLFGIVGYIVQSAQLDMLGIGTDGNESVNYFISAANFLSDTAMVIANGMIGRELTLAGHFAQIVVATTLTVAILLWPRWTRIRGYWRPQFLSALLLMLLAGKFLVFDAPLSRVENVVLRDVDKPALNTGRPVSPTAPIVGSVRPKGNGVERWMTDQADSLIDSIVCSRANRDTIRRNPSLKDRPRCQFDQTKNRRLLNGEYLSQLWMAALILLISGTLLRSRPTRPATVIGVLAVAYLLSLPYAYGKLMRSTYFDYGTVQLAQATTAAGTAATPTLDALVLSRGAAGASLLVAQQGPCSGSGETSVTVARSWLSAGRIVSIEQIYRADVIAWATDHQKRCEFDSNSVLP